MAQAMTAHRLEQLQALFSDSQWFKADEGQELLDEIERAWGEIERLKRSQIEPATAADAWPPARIAEALERCERATPGEWLSVGTIGEERPEDVGIRTAQGWHRATQDDRALMRAARTDLPSALRALATAQGRLQHAHDSANRLYQAAREVVANAEHVACTRHNDVNQQIFVTPGAGLWIDAMTLGVLRAAIDPTEEAAALAEVQRRDGLAAEIERRATHAATWKALARRLMRRYRSERRGHDLTRSDRKKHRAEIERLNRLVVATANADPSWVERCTTQAAEIERLATALQAERAAWQEASGADSPGHLTAALKARRARLTAELAARVPALFDGPPRTLYQPNGPDGRPEDAGAPADASLEALGRIVRAAWVEVAKKEAKTVPGYVDLWKWLEIPDADTDRKIGEQVVRAVDASRPAAPEVDAEDLWADYRTERPHMTIADRVAFLAGVEAGRRTSDASRPGLTEEQARAWERLRTAATTAVEAYEDSDADEAFEPLFAALDEALAGLAIAEEESASRGEAGPAPTGLTSAMHAAQQRRSVPPASAFGEWPDEPRGGLTCPGCYDATGIAQPHDPRATLRAGDPASPFAPGSLAAGSATEDRILDRKRGGK